MTPCHCTHLAYRESTTVIFTGVVKYIQSLLSIFYYNAVTAYSYRTILYVVVVLLLLLLSSTSPQQIIYIALYTPRAHTKNS